MLKEMLFSQAMLGSGGGGGGGSKIDVTPLDVTKNGTYSGGSSSAFNPVTVNVSPSYPEAELKLWNVSPASTPSKVTITRVDTVWDTERQCYYLGEVSTSTREGRSSSLRIPIYPAGEAIVKIEFETFKNMSGDIEVFDASKNLYRITGSCMFSAYGIPI